MILRVILKNFLSFNKEVQFDMFPNLKRTSLANHIIVLNDQMPILKMAAIYGANGAGKSNLFKGINFLKNFTTHKNFINKESIGKYFFALKNNANSEPIELTIEFTNKIGVPFIYSVELMPHGVVFETLQISGLGQEKNINVFTRKNENIEYAIPPSDEVKNIILKWIEANPFACLLTINNDIPVLADNNINIAQEWFEDELTIIGLYSFNPSLIGTLKNNSKINQFASNFLKAIDLGLDSIKIETENFEDWISTHDVGDLPIEKLREMHFGGLSEVVDFRNTRFIDVENGVQKISQIMFKHFGENGFSKDMDIQAQSDGTVRILSLIPALYDAINTNKTIIIDELDHSIHPHLVCQLIQFFSSQKTKGQLIFTTHQTCLLNQDIMRSDEIWMIEKKDGCSLMYSLNDFKIHNTIKIENGYMEGRYGAIPFIGELNI